MHPLIVLGLLVLLLVSVWLYLNLMDYTKEGFELLLDPAFVKSYSEFAVFYNKFMSSWKKAVMTSLSINSPAPAELTSPSQTGTATAKEPSQKQLNAYIKKLSTTQKFPPVTDDLPLEIKDRPAFEAVKDSIPTDIQPYLNALTWMNKNIAESHSQLAKMQEGFVGGIVREFLDGFLDGFKEGFVDAAICPAVVQCMDAQKAQSEQDFSKKQQVLTAVLDQFNTSSALKQLMKENTALVAKSADIQKKAQSGELLSSMPKSTEPPVVYSLPPGANALDDLQQSDPEKYKEYEKNYAPLFGMKQQFDQINRNLR